MKVNWGSARAFARRMTGFTLVDQEAGYVHPKEEDKLYFIVRPAFNSTLPDKKAKNFSVEAISETILQNRGKKGFQAEEIRKIGNVIILVVSKKHEPPARELLAFICQMADLVEEPKEISASEAEEILKQGSRKEEITAEYAIFPPNGDKRTFSEIEEIYFGVVRRLKAKFPADNIYVSGEGGRRAVFCIIPQEQLRAFEKEAGREKQNHGLEIRRLNV